MSKLEVKAEERKGLIKTLMALTLYPLSFCITELEHLSRKCFSYCAGLRGHAQDWWCR